MEWLMLGTTYNVDEGYADYKSAIFWLSSNGAYVKVKLTSYYGSKEDKEVVIPVSRYGSVLDVIKIYGSV